MLDLGECGMGWLVMDVLDVDSASKTLISNNAKELALAVVTVPGY